MKKKIFSVLLILTLVLSFGLAGPVSAATIDVSPGGSIQEAITAASPGDTINVAAGTYVGDLVIPEGKDNLELAGAEGATIKGVALSEWNVSTLPNINVLADGASIHGFTIQGPEPAPPFFAAGMIIGAPNVGIYGNAFEVNNASEEGEGMEGDDIGQAIVTWNKLAIPGTDISGLSIHDNTFTHRGVGIYGYEGIYVNRDVGVGSISIANNTFTGDIVRAITTERSNVDISGNSLVASAGLAWTGVLVMDIGSSLAIDSVSIIGNTIEGFGNSVKIGDGGHEDTLTNIDVSGNSLGGNVLVRASAEGVTVIDNSLGTVENTDGAELDASYNWWGQSTGPVGQVSGAGTTITAPWLLSEGGSHYDLTMSLPAGWSIISPDLELSGWEIADSVGLVYAYDNGAFIEATALDPVSPVFVGTADGGGVGFNYVAESMGIFSTDLEAGWNLIGVPATSATAGAILSPLRYGAGSEIALATLASQGNYNPGEVSFYRDMTGEWSELPTLFHFDGYWAYMNVAKEFGVIVVE